MSLGTCVIVLDNEGARYGDVLPYTRETAREILNSTTASKDLIAFAIARLEFLLNFICLRSEGDVYFGDVSTFNVETSLYGVRHDVEFTLKIQTLTTRVFSVPYRNLAFCSLSYP